MSYYTNTDELACEVAKCIFTNFDWSNINNYVNAYTLTIKSINLGLQFAYNASYLCPGGFIS